VNLTTHDLGFETLDGLADVEALCLFIAEDERPLRGTAGYLDWRMCGEISRLLKASFFTGALGDRLLMPGGGHVRAAKVFAQGIGQAKSLSPEALGGILQDAGRMLTRARVSSVALEVPGAGALDEAARAQALRRLFLPEFKGAKVAVLAERGLARLVHEAA
jgi:hypothetical protein